MNISFRIVLAPLRREAGERPARGQRKSSLRLPDGSTHPKDLCHSFRTSICLSVFIIASFNFTCFSSQRDAGANNRCSTDPTKKHFLCIHFMISFIQLINYTPIRRNFVGAAMVFTCMKPAMQCNSTSQKPIKTGTEGSPAARDCLVLVEHLCTAPFAPLRFAPGTAPLARRPALRSGLLRRGPRERSGVASAPP